MKSCSPNLWSIQTPVTSALALKCLLFCLLACTTSVWPASAQVQTLEGVVAEDSGVQQLLWGLKAGDVYAMPDLEISKTLSINSSITLRGSREGRPSIITCTKEITALEISVGHVTLDNLVIERCGNPAIKLAARQFEDEDDKDNGTLLQATFKNMSFRHNGKAENFQIGGALKIDPGWNVTINGCTFLNNKADIGGAVASEGSNVSVSASTFEDNVALHKGGALAIEMSKNADLLWKFKPQLHVAHSQFVNNSNLVGGSDAGFIGRQLDGSPIESNRILILEEPTPSGGAVFAAQLDSVKMQYTTFSKNVATSGGGAVYLHNIVDTKIEASKFISNTVKLATNPFGPRSNVMHGGAIYAASPRSGNLQVLESEFRDNYAGHGGGLHVVGIPAFKVTVSMCSFIKNQAVSTGGAAILRSVDTQWEASTAKLNVAKFGGGITLTNGGRLFVRRDGQSGGRLSLFEDNSAFRGGAILLHGAGGTSVQEAVFKDNKALVLGGALAALDGLPDSRIVVSNSIFENNSAGQGGAIGIDGCPSVELAGSAVEITPDTILRKNQALDGGALFFVGSSKSGNYLKVERCSFESNTAHGNISQIVEITKVATHKLEALLEQVIDVEGFHANLDQSATTDTYGRQYAHGSGGAVIIYVRPGVTTEEKVDIRVASSSFVTNVADLGGALMVSTSQKGWVSECPTETANETFQKLCRRFLMKDNNFTSNKALKAGGALFAANMRNVYIAHASRKTMQMALLIPEDIENYGLTNNSVANGGYGDGVASDFAHLNLLSGRVITETHASGAQLPRIELEVMDWHRQRIINGIPAANVVVDARADVVFGSRLARAHAGVAVFENLTAFGKHGQYTIAFTAEYGSAEPVNAEFTIRSCFPGEAQKSNFCERCRQGYFSLHPTEPCQSCPEDAVCPSGAALVPLPGFWHSTPYSTYFHKCLARDACSYTHEGVPRSEKLQEYYEANRTPSNLLVSNNDYPQCSEGYESVLCASCCSGYGKVQSKCKKCQEAWRARFYIFCGALWSLIILGVAVRSALVSFQEMNAVTKYFSEHANSIQFSEHRTPSSAVFLAPMPELEAEFPNFSERSYSSVMGCKDTSNFIYNLLFGKVAKEKLVSGEQENPGPSRDHHQLARAEDYQGSAQLVGLTRIRHFIAAENLSETLKIFVNYLQVTSLVAKMNTDWTLSVLKMFAVQDFLAGFSSAEAIASPECAISKDSSMALSIGGSLIRMSMPLILYIVVCCSILTVFYAKKSRNSSTACNPTTALVISLMAVLFLAYMKLSEEFMKNLNCIHADEPNPEESYNEFAIAQDLYWAEDTQIQCFKGQHIIVAVLGSIGLLVITIGAPVSLWILLLYLRRHDLLFEPVYMKRFGFLYQTYHLETVYWEVLILLRKASIASVVVFGHELGANLQSILVLGIFIVALVFHMLLLPFKYNHLNQTESASLIVSIITTYSGVMFHGPELSQAGRMAVTIFVLVANAGVFVSFLLWSLVLFDRYAESKLISYGVSVPNNPVVRYCKFITYFVLTSLPERAKLKVGEFVSRWKDFCPEWSSRAHESRRQSAS